MGWPPFLLSIIFVWPNLSQMRISMRPSGPMLHDRDHANCPGEPVVTTTGGNVTVNVNCAFAVVLCAFVDGSG